MELFPPMGIVGGCHCKKLRYSIAQRPKAVYACHCTDCQCLTGSAFSIGLVVAAEAFTLSGPPPHGIERITGSGSISTR